MSSKYRDDVLIPEQRYREVIERRNVPEAYRFLYEFILKKKRDFPIDELQEIVLEAKKEDDFIFLYNFALDAPNADIDRFIRALLLFGETHNDGIRWAETIFRKFPEKLSEDLRNQFETGVFL